MRLPAERIPTLPAPLRTVLRNAVWTFGRLTAGARPLPTFLVLGAPRAGMAPKWIAEATSAAFSAVPREMPASPVA